MDESYVQRVRAARQRTAVPLAVLWYTSLENGEATGVSAATLKTVAEALRLSESEREDLLALAGLSQITQRPSVPELIAEEHREKLGITLT